MGFWSFLFKDQSKGGVGTKPISAPPHPPGAQNPGPKPEIKAPAQQPEAPKPLTPAEKEDKCVKQYVTTFVLKHEVTGKPWLYLHVDVHGIIHVEFRGSHETFDGGLGTNVSDGLADAIVKARAGRTKKRARKKKK